MAAKRPRLVQRRRVAGFSQDALASALSIERSTVVRWESGETAPQPWVRPKLAEALQVSLDELNELLAHENDGDASANGAAAPGGRRAGSPRSAGPGAEPVPVCQLPLSVADFTGREPQIKQLVDVLTSHDGERVGVPIAVIAGLPGSGKTALALQVAHLVRAVFPDAQLWIALEGGTQSPRDPGDVLGELIRALGVPGSAIPHSVSERASLYRSLLAGRRVLVLADDAASAAQVQPLLPGTGQSAVLVTSRSELAGPPGSRLITLDPLTSSESVQLLAKIVGNERVAAEADAAAELAAACGQLPLAVRIAGARLAGRTSWQVSALARKITHARRRLDEFQSGDMSVRASLTQAYQALDDSAQRAFRRLALLDSAEFAEWHVAALLGVEDATEVLNHLADSSLLTAAGIDRADQTRYRPHDLVRDYAAERLADDSADEQEAARSRVTDGWRQLAARADAALPREPFFPEPAAAGTGPPVVSESLAETITADATTWFTIERLALLAVIERCCTTGGYQAASQLASLLASFQHLQGRLDDTERTWRMITAAAEQAGDAAAAAGARLRLAAAACYQGRHAQAGPLVDQCVAAFVELGDQRGLATALYWRSVCEWNLGQFAEARQSAERSLELAQNAGNRQVESMALRLMALATANLDLANRGDEAVSAAEKALALAGQLGRPVFEHEVRHTVAGLYSLTGRHQDALDIGQRSLAEARRLGSQVAIADWLGIVGDAYRGLARYGEAAESLGEALPMYRDQFMRRHQGLCLLKLGYAYQAMGDCQTAADHLRESLEVFRQLQLDHFAARASEALLAGQTAQHSSGPDTVPGGPLA
jgi:tetratricopeptide (TPR) repeat protein/transcriptional regulator with XRE-family HTH domain